MVRLTVYPGSCHPKTDRTTDIIAVHAGLEICSQNDKVMHPDLCGDPYCTTF